jgi:HK97 family phage prohead protease
MTDKNVTRFQIRAAEDKKFMLVGRAVAYNKVSSNQLAPGVREMFAPGAFRKSLASGKDVVCLLNHNSQSALPLGRRSNGTLELEDDEDGLRFRCQLDSGNTQHRDVYRSIQRGDIKECSFAFNAADEDLIDGEYEGERCKVRCVREADIHDVSVVTSPFYGDDATGVAARSKNEPNELLERALAMPAQWEQQERINRVTREILKG